jgi:hypothetical protein
VHKLFGSDPLLWCLSHEAFTSPKPWIFDRASTYVTRKTERFHQFIAPPLPMTIKPYQLNNLFGKNLVDTNW